jgi:hypothetical protein
VNPIYYGTEDALPGTRTLRAGPLAMELSEGGLRRIRWGGVEVVRRIYGAVRDRNWNTVPGAISDLEVREEGDSFRVSFTVRCRQREIDYRWKGTIEGTPAGSITFVMDGEALSTFPRNRIGLCVLHPIRECAGKPCVVEHASGAITRKSFPRYVWPHQPFKSVRAITHEVAPGLRAAVRFDGDAFEMEDQRNWTDASFKTYSTPLDIPFPVELPKGSGMRQTVTLALEGSAPPPAAPPAAPLVFALEKPAPLPRLGLATPFVAASLSPREVELLRGLGLSHLRADLWLGRPGWQDALASAAQEAASIDASLELALHLSQGTGELEALAAALSAAPPRIDRILVFHVGEKSTGVRWVREAKRFLAPAAGAARVGAGTDAYFAELNRGEHPPEFDVVAYSVTPQVHATDILTLVENLEGLASTVESGRLFPGERPLAVTPVTFLPRFNPNATAATAESTPPSDPRQRSLFGAAWTAAGLKRLAESGVESVTYFETRGERGVLSGDGRSVHPLYHVFADAGAFAGGQIVRSRSSDPLRVDGLALRKGAKTRVLLANFWPDPQKVEVRGLSPEVRVRMMDEDSAVRAAADPQGFFTEPGEARQAPGGRLELELPPCAVARIDA